MSGLADIMRFLGQRRGSSFLPGIDENDDESGVDQTTLNISRIMRSIYQSRAARNASSRVQGNHCFSSFPKEEGVRTAEVTASLICVESNEDSENEK